MAIRILSAMVGDRDPLYVIDGTPTMADGRIGFNWFEPEDVAEIKVLRYPAETAVYGPRAVNGVVLITTKQAARVRSKAP